MNFNPKAKRKDIHLSRMKTLRFTENEIFEIENECKIYNQKFSTYARKKILNINMKTNLELEKILQIKKIGNNINQIAKRINENKSDEKIEVLQKLLDIENQLKKLNNDS